MISLTSPVETAAHRWPAGLKLLLLCAGTMVLFRVQGLALQALFCLVMLALYAVPGKAFTIVGLRRLWVLWPFVGLIAAWHLVLWQIAEGAIICLRMITAVGLANLVTMTTRLEDMMGVVRRICAPLTRVGVRPERIALAMGLVVRFTPVLAVKGKMLSQAWRARSAKPVGWRIVLPFAVLAIDDAEHVAEALRARGGL